MDVHTLLEQVKPQAMEQIKLNKSTKSDVERVIGYPPRKQNFGKGEI